MRAEAGAQEGGAGVPGRQARKRDVEIFDMDPLLAAPSYYLPPPLEGREEARMEEERKARKHKTAQQIQEERRNGRNKGTTGGRQGGGKSIGTLSALYLRAAPSDPPEKK